VVAISLGDIIGPVMIGPSSSHTAGAARLGKLAAVCLGIKVKSVNIYLRGSFQKTSRGHGTDRALVGGLLGMSPDDPGIRDAFAKAEAAGLSFRFLSEDVDGAHPNSARFVMIGVDGKEMEVIGASTGGGAVVIQEIDGFKVGIKGEYPTLVTFHDDVKGVVASVTSMLAAADINIAFLGLSRKSRSGTASMVIEMDNPLPSSEVERIMQENVAIKRAFMIDARECC
jgi:L-serine dehydratase